MKTRIAVIFGGKSVEHEISIISAVQAMRSMDTEKYDIYPVYIAKDNTMYCGQELFDISEFKNIKALTEKCRKVIFVSDGGKCRLISYPHKAFKDDVITELDAAFPIVHGTNVEDGALQGYLRTVSLPFVGCEVLSSAVGMDKYVMKILLREAGIPVLDCLLFSSEQSDDISALADRTEAEIGYPVIVKPVNLGSSVGISKAADREEFITAAELAFTFSQRVLVERAVPNLKEINCSVLGDFESAEPSECEEPVAADKILSYEDKYMSSDGAKSAKSTGSKGMASLKRKIPADISDEMRDKIRTVATDAFRALDCSGVARIDFLCDAETGEFWLNEINTIPGSLSFYLWEPLGVKYTELLDRMIALAFKRKRRTEDITYSFDTNVLANANFGGAKGAKGSKS